MDIDISQLTVEELDRLIEKSAARRADLGVPYPDTPSDVTRAVVDPRWFVKNHNANTFLQVLYPGYGWLSCVIPPRERANLLTVLLRQALEFGVPNQTTTIGEGGGRVH